MKEKLISVFSKYGFTLSELQIEQFIKYYQYLIQENEKFNLTAITEAEQVIVKHFLDSVLPIKEFSKNAWLIDVGSGAGFPGLPIKIMRPDLHIVLLDSLQKRVNFLNECISLLKLDNIEAVHFRAEDYVKLKREKFDYAVSRAVAQTDTLVEYLLPYIKVGGKACLYKSHKIEEELPQAKVAIKTLGGEFDKTLSFNLQESESERNIAFIKKVHQTPIKYPRGKNLPKIKPIN